MSEPGLIYQAIPKVMATVGAIQKGRRNTQQNYAFRGIDDVFAAFQKPLAENGVFYVPEVLEEHRDERETRNGGTLFYTRLRIQYTFYATDGSFVRAVVQGEAMDSADKSSNKAMSAALKYALLQIFCVPVEQEDADQETPELAAQTKGATQTKTPTAKSETKAPPKGRPADETAERRAELCALNKRLGYSDVQLLAWLVKRFALPAPSTLAAALAALTAAQLSQAIDSFRAKLDEQQ